MLEQEQSLQRRGIRLIAGVDEAGRGPLAGPVVAAAVIVPDGYQFKTRIDDSKKLSAAQRERARREIENNCLWATARSDAPEIDRINILQATLAAMGEAVNALALRPQWILIDGPYAPVVSVPFTTMCGGDQRSLSIACASIMAKTTRDRLMLDYDREYPGYGFARHKGYGTREHCQALQTLGPCAIHRRTFAPVCHT